MESSNNNNNTCMNEACRATTSSGEWKKGWVLKSGGLAALCYNCGSAYENLIFCDTFHREESGWRECKFCGKHIHCGCIASKSLHDYLDSGGVGCLSCIKFSETQLIRQIQNPSDDIFGGLGTLAAICDPQSSVIENYMEGKIVTKGKLTKPSKSMEGSQSNGHDLFLQSQQGEQNLSSVPTKKEVNMLPKGEVGTGVSHVSQHSNKLTIVSKPDATPQPQGPKDMYESLAQPSLNFSFGAHLSTSNSMRPLPGEGVEGRDKNKVPPFQQGQRSRQILPKSSKPGIVIRAQGSNGTASQTRVARPPVEGRGRSQLLPRYWPRITDQELQKICGDLNSTIVPLFEKVLSASDAGRIGRLVLPKACAEAYFPPINQSEGVPIRMKDIKGKEWTFQFRFWPNNNSRMYVLEGVTPCIQNMQLQAGDTVTFSRIDPEGMLVMGCRKAANSGDNRDMQDSSTPSLPNGGGIADDLVSAVKVDQPTDAFDWMRKEEQRGQINGESTQQQMGQPEKKKSRIIGSKSKRLLMRNEDANELQITWEEAQELLRPSPSAKPTIVLVDNHEFEEYDDPPVFGKKTIFTARESGEQEQWAQCDNCSKWRRLPADVLLPANWICSDNIWDSNRCSCSAPDEMDPKKLENCFRDTKKKKLLENGQECEPSRLDALASAAVFGDPTEDSGEPSLVTTTRHPRHRPGCTCIVCIQPPSGKGKHKPTCICNVCMTVKRRFKTLMLRKKKRQEREAEINREKTQIPLRSESEVDGTSEYALLHVNGSETDKERSVVKVDLALSSNKGDLDLNCDPNREDDSQIAEATGTSLASFVPVASLTSDICTGGDSVPPTLGACLISQAVDENEEHLPEETNVTSMDVEEEQGDEEF
ncbi:B3 domain-containing transcription repressor VAL1 isoform X2 [Daucus carota subsp. sativus]|uniref:B3 domain-containing transcription repressor VAL1 isoform X2 n=1 Tax=Daucus carota subsp. sativus TaxID=79200 RepID=UPI0007EF2DC9|nr:PREDICTED: B3 domain-containing transcription repressor VAL1-like isoform X2 [Daucus carota subsp. sativus]